MALPSPVRRRGQKIYKPDLWDRLRKASVNLDSLDVFLTDMSPGLFQFHTGLSTRRIVAQEIVPFLSMLTHVAHAMPHHCRAIADELANFPPAGSVVVQAGTLDERDDVDISDISVDELPHGVGVSRAGVGRRDSDGEPMFLPEDDIVDDD